MAEIIFPKNITPKNIPTKKVENRNLSIQQLNKILSILNNNNTTRIRYWFDGRVVLITSPLNKFTK